jgi:hypothetical protein
MKLITVVRVVLNCLLATTLANAFSAPNPGILPREFIQITNPIHITAESRIPASFVRDWSTWVLKEDGTLAKIPDDDGFVQPASIDELWQPIDLKRPELRLALGIHVCVSSFYACGLIYDVCRHSLSRILSRFRRGGVIRQLMPAVDVSLDGGLHRNRGMCSVPRAHAWIDFTNSLDEWDNYRIVLSKKKNGEETWTDICSSSSTGKISSAIERVMVCLAESAPDEIGEGSHFVNVLLESLDDESEVAECPKIGSELRVIMDDDDFLGGPDEAPGILQVAITATVAGSESEYLPQAYEPLYYDESLRNPLFAKYKQRRKDSDQKKNDVL